MKSATFYSKIADRIPQTLQPSTSAGVFWIFLFLSQVGGSLYQFNQLPHSGLFQLLSTIAYGWTIWWWLEDDSKRFGINWPQDLGMFVFITWFLLLPYYLIKTRGFNGIILILVFFVAQIAAWHLATILWVILLQ